MALYKQQNFARKPIEAKDGDCFEGCNLSQAEPGTPITDAKDLTFTSCNLTNVLIDKSWKTPDCNTAQVVFEPEPDYAEQALKEEIKQTILNKYAAEFDRQLATAKASEVDPKTLEASVIAAVSVKPIAEPIGKGG